MVDAQMTVNKDDSFVGSGHYHLNVHGGLDLGKYAGGHSKIDPVMDELRAAARLSEEGHWKAWEDRRGLTS
jgi:hypothetical protein